MNKKILTAVLLIILFPAFMYAQAPDWSWARGVGSDVYDGAYAVTVDDSGNVYTTGYFSDSVDFDPGAGVSLLVSAYSFDAFILKLNSSGDFKWVKQIKGNDEVVAYSIALDDSANILITGYFQGTADFNPDSFDVFNMTAANQQQNIFVAKYNNNGNFIWAKQMGSGDCVSVGKSITTDDNGNVYVAGSYRGIVDFNPGIPIYNIPSTLNGGKDIFLQKLTATGNFIWAKSIGGLGDDICTAIALDNAGNIYSTGNFADSVDFDPDSISTFFMSSTSYFENDVFISKFDNNGNFIWAKELGGINTEESNSLALDANNNVYITGTFGGTVDFDPGNGVSNLISIGSGDAFILKSDNSGNYVWAKSVGGVNSDLGQGIKIDAFGNVYSIGAFRGTADFDAGSGVYNLNATGAYGIFILKSNSSGNFDWAKSVGGTWDDYAYAIALNNTGNIYVAGQYSSYNMAFDTCTISNASIQSTYASDIFIAKIGSAVNGINFINVKNNMSITPNPCTTCEITGATNANDLMVTDIIGRKQNASFSKSANGFYIHLPEASIGILIIRNYKTGEVVKFVRE